jgi:hypothetical protein
MPVLKYEGDKTKQGLWSLLLLWKQQIVIHMINDPNFNEQQQANEISSVTSNSTQWCPTINHRVQKQMKVLWKLNMQVLVLGTFLSSLLFSFEQVATESK